MTFNTYWLTFELKAETTAKGTYQERYNALIEALQTLNDGWWAQPTSFIVFGSTASRAAIITKIKAAVDLKTDIVVLGMPNYKTMEVVGAATGFEALESMVPFVKKV